jgi:predicted transcriptional regulator of viral defense system
MLLRDRIARDIFDYPMLLNALGDYSYPRDRITKLLKKGEIIQLRRGLYIFSTEQRKGVVSKEVIANALYGPSYISLEYALSYYGIIPEQTHTVTSVCLGRSREYANDFGAFTYNKVKDSTYSIGVELISTPNTSFLMATPEKALIDKIAFERQLQISNVNAMQKYLLENLRADTSMINTVKLQSVADTYCMKRTDLLVRAVRGLK